MKSVNILKDIERNGEIVLTSGFTYEVIKTNEKSFVVMGDNEKPVNIPLSASYWEEVKEPAQPEHVTIKALQDAGISESFIRECCLDWKSLNNLLVAPPVGTDAHSQGLKLGDVVRFKNDYGVCFYGSKIIGFNQLTTGYDSERNVYTDCDSYWFASLGDQIRVMTALDWHVHALQLAAKHADSKRKFDKSDDMCRLSCKVESKKLSLDKAKEELKAFDVEFKTDFLSMVAGK